MSYPKFDITPFLFADDPFVTSGNDSPEFIRRIYEEKYNIARLLKPRSILEIGVRAGYSAAAFLSACKDLHLGTTYLGIDYDSPDDCNGGWHGAFDKARVMIGERFGVNASFLKTDTQTLDKNYRSILYGNYRFDLVHIDGNHSYKGCLNDLEVMNLKSQYMLVDDYTFLPDVRRAVDDFLAKYGYPAIQINTARGDMLIMVED